MTRKTITFATVGLAGLVAAGALTIPSTAAPDLGEDAAITKREESSASLVLVDDNDDDGPNDNTRGQTRTRTGHRDDQAIAAAGSSGAAVVGGVVGSTRGQTRTRTGHRDEADVASAGIDVTSGHTRTQTGGQTRTRTGGHSGGGNSGLG